MFYLNMSDDEEVKGSKKIFPGLLDMAYKLHLCIPPRGGSSFPVGGGVKFDKKNVLL